MKKQQKVLLSFILIFAMVMGVSVPSANAAKKVKLSSKKVTITIGKTKKIKVKNTRKTVKWKITKGKKYIKLTKKKKTSVTVKGKKKGKAVVLAKIDKKKLTCKVTVKKVDDVTGENNQRKTPTATPTKTPAATPSGTSSAAPPNSITNTDTPAPAATAEAVQNLTIDLSKCDTVFTASPAMIDFSSQIDSRFDLSLYSSLKISYKLTFEDNDSSDYNCGKLALAQTKSTLNGYDDGIKNTMAMSVGGQSVSLSLSNLSGTALGINIQPMSGKENNYAWPKKLTSVTITGIEFIAKKGAVYPDPNKPAAPTPTPEPTYAPEEFNYEGINIDWIDTSKPMVAFTFDDGPVGDTATSNSMIIHKALKKYGAHATFFYIGSQINTDGKKNEILQAKENGFEVGNHSWGWGSLADMTASEIKTSVGDTNAKLTEITGYSNFLFRAPYLDISSTMKGYIKAPFINSSIDSKDWDKATKAEIIANVKKAGDGDIVLMHETENNTKEAIEELLDYFINEKGYQVVSVSELFAAKNKKLMTGSVYSNAK